MTMRFLLAALFAAAPAIAADLPRPVAGDPHIQIAAYDRDGVTLLRGQLGFQTMIEFQDDERIENVAIGDATAWQVTPNKRANILFVKPIASAGLTNMTVVTDKRRYAFALSTAVPKQGAERAAWVLRFRLPPVAAPVRLVPAPPPPLPKNADYTMSGAAELMPATVYDDGTKTYFAWGPQTAIPAIFAVNPDGSESVTNPSIRDGQSVVEQLAGQYVLRSGASKAIITSTPGVQRRLIKSAGK